MSAKPMRRLATAAFAALGAAALLLGLLFVIGSAGQVRRLLIGGFCVVSGAGLIGVAVRRITSDAANSPERMRAEILELAKREDGEISSEEIAALAGERNTVASAVLESLIAGGTCRLTERGGSPLYVFPRLQPRLTVLRCEYCATEQHLNSGFSTCPKCGGPLAKHIVARSLAEGEVFNMDQETPS